MLKQLRLYGLTQKKRNTLCTVLLVILLIYVFTWIQRPTTSVREYYTPLTSKLSPCMVEIDCKRFYQTCSNSDRKKYVKEAFLFAWTNYHNFAWGHDHLKPESRGYDDSLFGLSATLIDSLTSLHLLGFKEELAVSRAWIEESFDPKKSSGKISLFEVTIRLIGSLISTYHLTGDELYLDKAMEIGNISMNCFKDSELPHIGLSLSEGTCNTDQGKECLFEECSDAEACKYYYCRAEISEVGTLGLEFRALSAASGDMRYWKTVNKTSNELLEYKTWHGLVSRYLYRDEGRYVESSDVAAGPGVDSYYEYLLKQWVHSHFTASRFKSQYLQAVEGMKERLMVWVRLRGRRVRVLGHRANNVTLSAHLHHLSCFLPGTLALGHFYGLPKWHLDLAEEIMQSCYYLYTTQPTGLAAEFVRFRPEGVEALSSENHLRPETVESLFVLWRVTGKEKYRDMAWNIFQAFERVSRTCNGYTTVYDVRDVHTVSLDVTESFFLAETLKYLYLLFEDDDEVLSFDKWVFNTEAHPLPILDDFEGWY